MIAVNHVAHNFIFLGIYLNQKADSTKISFIVMRDNFLISNFPKY